MNNVQTANLNANYNAIKWLIKFNSIGKMWKFDNVNWEVERL